MPGRNLSQMKLAISSDQKIVTYRWVDANEIEFEQNFWEDFRLLFILQVHQEFAVVALLAVLVLGRPAS